MKEDVGYEEVLAAVYEAENGRSEGGVLNVEARAVAVGEIVDEEEHNDLKDLKQIESQAMIMKSATMGGMKWKVKEGVSSPRKKEMFRNSPQKGVQGSPRKGKVSLRPGQKPIKCFRCDGWGHGWRECPNPENLNWKELVGAVVPSNLGNLGSTPTQTPNQNQ